MVVYDSRILKTSGLACKSGTELLIYSKPRNRKANPIINSPQLLEEFFFENNNGTPKPIKGTANVAMLTLKPNKEITHAVAVVPTLAPIITAID